MQKHHHLYCALIKRNHDVNLPQRKNNEIPLHPNDSDDWKEKNWKKTKITFFFSRKPDSNRAVKKNKKIKIKFILCVNLISGRLDSARHSIQRTEYRYSTEKSLWIL